MLISFAPHTGFAGANDLVYGGRLTNVDGTPKVGTANLQIDLFHSATGGSSVWAKGYNDVPLNQGMFSISMPLSNAERNAAFPANKEVWVQITDSDSAQVFPRQKYSAVPYAFKIPIDGSTLQWNSDGQLETTSTASGGSITSVNAGTGLTGGGTTGSVTLNVAQRAVSCLVATGLPLTTKNLPLQVGREQIISMELKPGKP
jgi:hypothetical protein